MKNILIIMTLLLMAGCHKSKEKVQESSGTVVKVACCSPIAAHLGAYCQSLIASGGELNPQTGVYTVALTSSCGDADIQ